MNYILNKLPVKTTNSFKVNDLKLDIELPKYSNKNNYNISNADKLIIKQEFMNNNLESRIGLSFNSYLNTNIVVPKDTSISETVIFECDFTLDDVLIDKININYEENSSCNFIFIYKSNDLNKKFKYTVIDSNIGDNANGQITFVDIMNKNSTNFTAINNSSLDYSNISYNIFDIGSNIKVYNFYGNVHNNASNNLNSIYLGLDNSIIDINYYLNNMGVNSKNNMKVEGAIGGDTKKVFRGTIDFLEGCKNSIGNESENCVILSDSAISRSLPQMLCHEEDVIGTHGVSSGKIDEDKLFYLMARGFNKKEAEKLIILANFSSIINNINDSGLRDDIYSILDNNL